MATNELTAAPPLPVWLIPRYAIARPVVFCLALTASLSGTLAIAPGLDRPYVVAIALGIQTGMWTGILAARRYLMWIIGGRVNASDRLFQAYREAAIAKIRNEVFAEISTAVHRIGDQPV
jgi:hypothetical protein